MIVTTTDNAPVLIPNKEHKNFTESSEVILPSTTLVGTFKVINGLRRGKQFDYRIFVTDDNKIIYANKVTPQPQEKSTEKKVTTTSEEKKFTASALLFVGIGAALGYYAASRKSKEITPQTLLYVVGGAVVGYYASKSIQPNLKNLTNK
jgi:hypothetical protein